MKTVLQPGVTEREELQKQMQLMKIFLYGFIAIVIVLCIGLAMPFTGLTIWFWSVLVFGGIMILAVQMMRLYMEQKINRYLTKGKIIFYEGTVTEHPGMRGWSKNARGALLLDGERVKIDISDYMRLKTGDRFAYLEWDELEQRIDSAIGEDAIALLKKKRNLP